MYINDFLNVEIKWHLNKIQNTFYNEYILNVIILHLEKKQTNLNLLM